MNALTVDIEEWYHSNLLRIKSSDFKRQTSTVVPNTLRLLDILDEYKVKATFFALGCVAKDHPDLIRDIMKRGHEVGSHGMNHQLVSELSTKEFEHDLYESINTLAGITGKEILYYRALSWSISINQINVLRIIERYGIICDSSLQPFQTPLSGIKGIKTDPFVPILNGRKLNMIEFPPTVWSISKNIRIPYAGGFYFRLFPYKFIYSQLKQHNKTRSGMIYIHPWEIDDSVSKVHAPLHAKLVHYHNLENTETKFRSLLKDFSFTTLGNVIADQNYPGLSINESTGRIQWLKNLLAH